MIIVFHCKHSLTLHESNMPPCSTGPFEPVIRWVHSRLPLDRQLNGVRVDRHSHTPTEASNRGITLSDCCVSVCREVGHLLMVRTTVSRRSKLPTCWRKSNGLAFLFLCVDFAEGNLALAKHQHSALQISSDLTIDALNGADRVTCPTSSRSSFRCQPFCREQPSCRWLSWEPAACRS